MKKSEIVKSIAILTRKIKEQSEIVENIFDCYLMK